MAVTLNTAALVSHSEVDGNTTHTVGGCTIAAGEAALAVALFRDSGNDVNTLTYAGSATGVALISGGQPAAAEGVGIAAYLITGRTGTAQNLLFTYNAGPSASHVWFLPFSGHDEVTPIGTIAFAAVDGSALNGGTVSGAVGGYFVSFIYSRTPTAAFAAGTGVTEFTGEINEAVFGSSSSGGHKAGAASDSVDWSWAGAQGTRMVTIPVMPAAGGGGSSIAAISHYYRMLRGGY
jgi:hypothetical protein